MKWHFSLCILLFVLLATFCLAEEGVDWDAIEDKIEHMRDRLPKRPTHRQYQLHRVTNTDLLNVDEIVLAFENDLNTMADRPTIKENVAEMINSNVTFPKSTDLAASLISQQNLITSQENLAKVLDSIVRTLNFYNLQLDEITQEDTALSLKILKDIDDKHGQLVQRDYPLNQWIRKACGEKTTCNSLISQWKNRSGRMNYWKPSSVLQYYLNKIDDVTLAGIGDEKEGLWGILNGECQQAIVERCEIPYICERTLLDETPRSQYLLTHQILQRLLIDNGNCPNLQKFHTKDDMYAKLCTKAYLEAQYLDLLDVPINHRDLFAEVVGFCGYLGYTNFLRVDWLERILSWQSESDSGCFFKDPLTPVGLLTTDMGFKRKATKKELQNGIEQPNEKCMPHLTAVALTAITAYWDYLMDLKGHQIRVGDHFEL